MADAEAHTEPTLPANVVGVEQDALIGERVRMSFGSRAFWGSVVDCYWVSGGLFYKVSFDDGDVDILSVDEVLRDAEAAKTHANENVVRKNQDKKKSGSVAAVDGYFHTLREYKLKRKRDEVVNHSVASVRHVNLWGQRLYASIYTNEENETFIKELLKTEDGQIGEMEATGQVKVGDMIVAVNETRVLGMSSRDLAELIRKPKRPVKLIFYRPHHSQLPVQQLRREQNEQPPTLSSSTLMTTTQTRHSTIHAAPPLPAVSPLSYVVPHQVFEHARPMAQTLAQQWTQPPRQLSSNEQRVSISGYPNGVYMPVPIGAYQIHPNQVVQSFTNSAAPGLTVLGAQPRRSMHQPLAVATQHACNSIPGDPRRGMGPIHFGTVQQSQTHRKPVAAAKRSSYEPTQSSQTTIVNTQRNVAQTNSFIAVPQTEMNAPVQSESCHYSSTSSRQPPSQAARIEQSSADTENTRRPISPALTNAPRVSTTDDIKSVTILTERAPKEAHRLLENTSPATSLQLPTDAPGNIKTENASGTMSFVSLSPSVSKPTGRESAGASQAMSFLSPNDFNVDLDTLSSPTKPIGSPAYQSDEVKSSVSLVFVKVTRSRLYLTLGVQGTLIAVTSFVPDECGKPGEVEMSGKVFIGDVLVRINHINILPGMIPNNVAEIVNSFSRPIILWFKRASWEILDGKA